MGSYGDGKIIGEFQHALIHDDMPESDPYTRNYGQPPPMGTLVARKYPLNDLRPIVSAKDYNAVSMLRSHGFCVVKHESPFLQRLAESETLEQHDFKDQYVEEIKQLVKATIGAKHIFVTGTNFRQGKAAPSQFVLPPGLRPATQAKDAKGDAPHKLAAQSGLRLGAPIRLPHTDDTPRGARQAIRGQSDELNEIAMNCGIIAVEDSIATSAGLSAVDREANQIIAERYNQEGGPHYAAYSIWRPLKPVGRDPIAIHPRVGGEAKGMVLWPYDNRLPGTRNGGQDFLKEFAMQGVDREEVANVADSAWYYLSRQQPDEVTFIKLFDSAALGAGSSHAPAPWHASPEIGNVEGDQLRESVEIRLMAFW